MFDLIKNWNEFVEHCEGGYSLSYFDYRNELGIRGEIERLIDKNNINESLLDELNSIDERFKVITKCLGVSKEINWWSDLVPEDLHEKWSDSLFDW